MVVPVNDIMKRRERRPHRGSSTAGFTLLELMIVITIILTLAVIAGVRYERSIAYTKEVTLRNDLSAMRQAIEQYTLDNLKPPQSLDDLVSGGCLGQIPVDPVTGIKDWTTESSGALTTDQQSGGISDVHSGSDKLSPFEHTPYSSW
jgi:general secretion pathway protein G